MPRVEPSTPSGQDRRENERQTYGGERRWEVGAGASWADAAPADTGARETDPESARWRGGDAGGGERGVLQSLSDKLGVWRGTAPRNYRRSDARIREDVCERLWDDPQIDVGDVSVEVREGVVTLEGTISDRRMKHRAEDIAAATAGVQDVHNRIRPLS